MKRVQIILNKGACPHISVDCADFKIEYSNGGAGTRAPRKIVGITFDGASPGVDYIDPEMIAAVVSWDIHVDQVQLTN